MLIKVVLFVNPFGEDIVEFKVITSLQPISSNILIISAAKQVWKSNPSLISSFHAEDMVVYGIKGMMAVIFWAPDRFIAAIARMSSIKPSLISLFSKDLIMKTSWPCTESNIWIPTSPSLNLLVMWRPSVVSRWVATSFPNIYASKAKIFKSVNSEISGVRKILLMWVSN